MLFVFSHEDFEHWQMKVKYLRYYWTVHLKVSTPLKQWQGVEQIFGLRQKHFEWFSLSLFLVYSKMLPSNINNAVSLCFSDDDSSPDMSMCLKGPENKSVFVQGAESAFMTQMVSAERADGIVQVTGARTDPLQVGGKENELSRPPHTEINSSRINNVQVIN